GKKLWTNIVTLVDGTNTFVATATDFTGKIGASVLRSVFLRTLATLTVNVHGGGHPIPVGTAFGSATSGAMLEINRGYFIRAVPNSGVTFVNWTDGGGNVMTNA